MNRRPCRTSCRMFLTRLRWRTATWSTAWEREDVRLAAVGSWVLCRLPFISSCMIWAGGRGWEERLSWGSVGLPPHPASWRLGRGLGGVRGSLEAGCLIRPPKVSAARGTEAGESPLLGYGTLCVCPSSSPSRAGSGSLPAVLCPLLPHRRERPSPLPRWLCKTCLFGVDGGDLGDSSHLDHPFGVLPQL